MVQKWQKIEKEKKIALFIVYWLSFNRKSWMKLMD